MLFIIAIFQTINHRKLVQELHDRRTLHNIVGVRPVPTVVKSSEREPDRKESSSSKSRSSRAVESAWDIEDVSHDSDHEEYSSRSRRHRPSADEEGGRYDIGRQPPKKRRKTGRGGDAHTVVFIDDDDDDDDQRRADEAEEDEYMSSESGDERRPSLSRRSSAKADHKRSYWLSKGIGRGSFDEQSS